MIQTLTQDVILKKIKEILSGYVEISSPLTLDKKLIDDLGLDSFLSVYFITEIEDQFKINIPETDFSELVTIQDLYEMIMQELRKKSASENIQNN